MADRALCMPWRKADQEEGIWIDERLFYPKRVLHNDYWALLIQKVVRATGIIMTF